MEKTTKKLIIRFVFWGVILAAPVVFLSMGVFYLNAYVTGERVNSIMIPVLESISERSVHIGSTNAHIGFISRFEFRDVDFFRKTGELNAAGSLPDVHIDRAYIQFKPLTLLANVFRIDSLLIDGFRGTIAYYPDKSYSRFVYTGSDGTRHEVKLDQSDLENIHIKSLIVKNTSFHYKNHGLNLEYILDDFYQEVQIEGMRVMSMLLVYGSAGGVLRDPASGEMFTGVSVSGRLQINFDDRTFILRGGTMVIDEQVFSFTAFLSNDEDISRLSLMFDDPPELIEESFEKLPPSIVQWLSGEMTGSRYQVNIVYAGDHAADQT